MKENDRVRILHNYPINKTDPSEVEQKLHGLEGVIKNILRGFMEAPDLYIVDFGKETHFFYKEELELV